MGFPWDGARTVASGMRAGLKKVLFNWISQHGPLLEIWLIKTIATPAQFIGNIYPMIGDSWLWVPRWELSKKLAGWEMTESSDSETEGH